jgi:PTS system nitrogen regulatory IIA component
MKIREAVSPDLVFLGLRASDAAEAIAAVAHELAGTTGLAAEAVSEALGEREKLGSTSVGNGFAIPHCKLDDLEDIVVALARFETGVEFGGNQHNEPVTFFFVVLSPPDRPAEHLQVLSQIARILKNGELRSELSTVTDVDAVVAAVERAADREGL